MRALCAWVLIAAACGGSDGKANLVVDRGVDAGAHARDASVLGPDGAVLLPEGCDVVDLTYASFAQAFFAARCLACHSEGVTGDARLGAPVGVDFDSEAQIAFHQARTLRRAVQERAMPPGAPLDDCEAAQLASYLQSFNGEGACVPACDAKDCGPDGCGSTCGTCSSGELCSSTGVCVTDGCVPDCSGRVCGDDGCGGSCGSCTSPGQPTCNTQQGQCVAMCSPDCSGRVCGDDGCGGSCGSCGSAQSCSSGQCVAITVTFDAVYAIFTSVGCGTASCHGGRVPKDSLDLSTKDLALAQLVDVDSQQCGGEKRVLPGDPTQSYLINKLTGVGMCSGSQMPKGSAALSAADIDTVRAWISGL